MKGAPAAAMVLAAGLGTRMRPLTNARPKPLVEVGGKTLLDHALDRFAEAGVERAAVNVHYFPEQIESHLAARRRPKIAISDERALLLETGGGLKKALPLLGADPVFCTNTDAILLDDPGAEACARLAAAFDATRMDALLLLAPLEHASGYDGAGDFRFLADDPRAAAPIAFRAAAASAPFVFTGLQIIAPALLGDAPEGPFSLKVSWDKAARAGRLFGLAHRGFWMHVGDPEGLRLAAARLAARP